MDVVCMAILAASVALACCLGSSTEVFGTLPGVRVVRNQHVGIYIRSGRLLKRLDDPGLTFYWPLLTRTHDVFTGIDHDVIPPMAEAPTDCRSKDGGLFRLRVDVSNRLRKEHIIDTVRRFGLAYDQVTIYDQAASSIKDVCSKMTSHEIAIEKYDSLDDSIAEKMRERVRAILEASVEIVQVKILDLAIPEDLNRIFAEQAVERARKRALIAQREADEEKITNERKLHEAKLAREEAARESEARKLIVDAKARKSAAQLDADAVKYSKTTEAQADKVWLTDERVRLEEARSDPVTVLLWKVRRSLWPTPRLR
jgi:regulator of protease activity HflC (stomatin/prohibitin superfamily)